MAIDKAIDPYSPERPKQVTLKEMVVDGKTIRAKDHVQRDEDGNVIGGNVPVNVTPGALSSETDSVEVATSDGGDVAKETGGNLANIKTNTDKLLPPSAHVKGRVEVAVTNTAVRFIVDSTTCRILYVQALTTNAGNVAVADGSGASIVAGSESGIQLDAGEKVAIEIDNVNKMYVNGADNDGVIYYGW